MKSIVAVVTFLASAGLAIAQTSSTTTQPTNPRLGKSPSDNAKPGAVAERAPGTWVSAARARHKELIDDRVREDNRNTENSAAATSTGTGTTTGTTTTGTTGSALSGLLGGLLSDPSAISGLAGLLGSGGGLSGLLGGTSKMRSDAEESADVMSLSGWGEMLAAFGSTGFSGIKTYLPKNATSQVRQDSKVESTPANADGASFTTGEKAEQRSQSTTPTTTTPTKFWKRLANSLLTTTFTALATGLTSANAINLFKDFLRPIFNRGETDNSNDGSNGSGNNNNNNNDNGSQVRGPAGHWTTPALA